MTSSRFSRIALIGCLAFAATGVLSVSNQALGPGRALAASIPSPPSLPPSTPTSPSLPSPSTPPPATPAPSPPGPTAITPPAQPSPAGSSPSPATPSSPAVTPTAPSVKVPHAPPAHHRRCVRVKRHLRCPRHGSKASTRRHRRGKHRTMSARKSSVIVDDLRTAART